MSNSSTGPSRRQTSSVASALLLVACVALLLANTAFAQESSRDSTPQSAVWRWVHSVLDEDTVVAPIDRDRYTVQFRAGGLVSVRADCNQVMGTYRQVGRRLSLQLGPSTLAACPPGSQADVFLQQLGAVVSQVSTASVLVLNLRQDSGSMIFEPQPALSLIGTNWQVLSYNTGQGAVTTLLPETEMTATFGDDGVLTGSSACNTYNGPYSVNEVSLSIGPLTTTRQACADDVMEQEQAYLAALQASTRYELTADRADPAERRRRHPGRLFASTSGVGALLNTPAADKMSHEGSGRGAPLYPRRPECQSRDQPPSGPGTPRG